jgi:hypothetical protein
MKDKDAQKRCYPFWTSSCQDRIVNARLLAFQLLSLLACTLVSLFAC